MPKSDPSLLPCSACLQPKARLRCGLCEKSLCKDCALFVDESSFSFLKTVPDELRRNTYCAPCYDGKVAPAKESYSQIMDRAKQVYVFFKKHHIPLITRSKHPVTVKDCPDRDEALLRLAFLAAEQSFNALLEVNLVSEKIYVSGYRSLSWSGSAFPAKVRGESIERHELGTRTEKPQPERIQRKKK
ncbi:MAG: hypothetical protein U1F57_10480 [bacterium]